MTQSKLTRGLLFSTLVLTLSTSCVLKISAQVINDFSSAMAQQEQEINNDQDLLQKIDILQQKAARLRQTVDIFNLRLQEEFNSPRRNNTVNEKKVLANWEQFNKIWHNFNQDLGENPELYSLLDKTQVINSINKNLLFQKEIISTLAQVLNESSRLLTTEFQEQLFTKRELNNSYFPNGTFETQTQHKFTLISTNKARELELQVSQMENILSNYILTKQESIKTINSGYRAIEATTIDSGKTKNIPNEPSNFLNFNTFIALFLLSSCAIFVVVKAYKQKNPSLDNKDYNQDDDLEISQNNVEDYLKNLQQVENQAREIINSTNQIIDHQKNSRENYQKFQDNNNPAAPGNNLSTNKQPNLNSSNAATNRKLVSQISPQALQESLLTNVALAIEEDLIDLYHKNRQLLLQKSIKVSVTKESLQRIKTGLQSEILFKETSNGSYWLVLEPKLENNCYFLVPNPILNFNALINQGIDNIFTCTRYNNRTSDNFNLKFSAMVQVQSSSTWKLIGTGEIIFS